MTERDIENSFILLNEGRYQESIEMLRKIIGAGIEKPQVHLALGLALLKQSVILEGLEHLYTEVILFPPGEAAFQTINEVEYSLLNRNMFPPRLYLRRAVLLHKLGKRDEALQICKSLQEAGHDVAGLPLLLAELHRERGEVEDSRRSLEKAEVSGRLMYEAFKNLHPEE